MLQSLRKRPWLIGIIGLFVCIATMADSCDTNSTANTQESNTVNAQQTTYNNNQPIPTYDFSLQRQLMIDLYNAQTSQAVTTYSYVYNQFLGTIAFSCVSEGYPIPGGTELTNPQTTTSGGSGSSYWGVAIGQAEPNGLYSPATSAGTWVFCLNANGKVSPQYVEENVLTFTQPMTIKNGQLVQEDPNASPSLQFSTQKPPKK